MALVEDHLFQRNRTESLVDAQPGLKVVWSGETLPDFTAWLASAAPAQRPHLLLLDLRVERGPSADPAVVRELTRTGLRVLVLSAMSSPELVRKILRSGVHGVAGKRDSEEDLVAAVWTVIGGAQWFTPELVSVLAGGSNRPQLSGQEERLVVLYASGSTLAAAAAALGVRKDTAKTYLSRVKAKYAEAGRTVSTKLDLRTAAEQDGYLDPPHQSERPRSERSSTDDGPEQQEGGP